MRVLVTGGAGYIGAHVVLELLQGDHEVISIDNFSNSDPTMIENLRRLAPKDFEFIQADVANYSELEAVLQDKTIDGIIHLAGYKSIAESFAQPLDYYQNNLDCTMNLLRYSLDHHVERFVFSSSATVYGNGEAPFKEDSPLGQTLNPYGETKKIGERIIRDFSAQYAHKKMTLLRYFNPIGAHPSALIGERPTEYSSNLMPTILKVASGTEKEVCIYGKNFPTPDGTGIRDYIHVVDLAKAHIAALEKAPNPLNIYNVGTGRGLSVLDLIHTFMRVNGMEVKYVFTPRRQGDIAISFADVSKIKTELGWSATMTVDDMVSDAWRYQRKLGEENEKNNPI